MSFDKKFDRKSTIGASEGCAVLDIDGHRRSRTVWIEKRSGLVEPNVDTDYTRAGNLLEPDVVRAYEDAHNLSTFDPEMTKRHREFPMLSATPDRIDKSGVRHALIGGLEAKCVFSEKSWAEWQGYDNPFKYEVQCRHSMAVWDLNIWTLIACRAKLGENGQPPTIDPTSLQVRTFYRDRIKEDWYVGTLALWWINHVETGAVVEEHRRSAGYLGRFQMRFDALTSSEASETLAAARKAVWGMDNVLL